MQNILKNLSSRFFNILLKMLFFVQDSFLLRLLRNNNLISSKQESKEIYYIMQIFDIGTE